MRTFVLFIALALSAVCSAHAQQPQEGLPARFTNIGSGKVTFVAVRNEAQKTTCYVVVHSNSDKRDELQCVKD